jgi:hypothetical protein
LLKRCLVDSRWQVSLLIKWQQHFISIYILSINHTLACIAIEAPKVSDQYSIHYALRQSIFD